MTLNCEANKIEQALVLFQSEADTGPVETQALEQRLRTLALIDAPLDYQGRAHFRPGEEFLYLLTFLGCSPVVALGEPGATGEHFCHVAITPAWEPARLLYGENVKTPRCRCGHRFEDWQLRLEEGLTPPWHCPACGKSTPVAHLKWRQCAGVARRAVVIFGIFEGEAVPGEVLMGALEGLSGHPWSYLYYRGPLARLD